MRAGIANSVVREAISGATGEDSHTVSDVDGGGALADVTFGTDEVGTNGAIIFT